MKTSVNEVRSAMRDAERKITTALAEMTDIIGTGWLIDIDVGAIDVTTIGSEDKCWTWAARISAKLKSGDAA